MKNAGAMRGSAALVALSMILSLAAPVFAQEQAQEQQAAEESASRHSALGPLLMMSAGGLVVIGGLTLFVVGGADRDAVESAPDGARWDDYASQAERGPIFLGVGQIMMAAGLIVVGAGLTWLVLVLADANPNPFGTAALELDVGPTGVMLGGRF
jgi:hypothetical protein